jgi:hypothetical protein
MLAMAQAHESIDWLALAGAERAHWRDARNFQWKVNLSVWALFALLLYAAYATEVVEGVSCWVCYTLYGFMVLHFLWTFFQQVELESYRARWSYYQSFADGAFTPEESSSIWRPRPLLMVLVNSGVTSALAYASCALLRSPPLH